MGTLSTLAKPDRCASLQILASAVQLLTLRAGKLDRSKFTAKSATTQVYVNKQGKRCFKGTSLLKSTQVSPRQFARQAGVGQGCMGTPDETNDSFNGAMCNLRMEYLRGMGNRVPSQTHMHGSHCPFACALVVAVGLKRIQDNGSPPVWPGLECWGFGQGLGYRIAKRSARAPCHESNFRKCGQTVL
ncbi:unnamed protein product [Effrenium voratum]|nr:unnamed protein product [Effrenium voratum]